MSSWIVEPIKCKLCGKFQYANRDDAEYAAKRIPFPLKAYRCLYGNGWHLTTPKKPVHAVGTKNM